MTKFTPGPWRQGNYEWLVEDDGDTCVAQAETTNPDWKANAVLIAAAPDLLASLRELYAMVAAAVEQDGSFRGYKETIGRAKALLAKVDEFQQETT